MLEADTDWHGLWLWWNHSMTINIMSPSGSFMGVGPGSGASLLQWIRLSNFEPVASERSRFYTGPLVSKVSFESDMEQPRRFCHSLAMWMSQCQVSQVVPVLLSTELWQECSLMPQPCWEQDPRPYRFGSVHWKKHGWLCHCFVIFLIWLWGDPVPKLTKLKNITTDGAWGAETWNRGQIVYRDV